MAKKSKPLYKPEHALRVAQSYGLTSEDIVSMSADQIEVNDSGARKTPMTMRLDETETHYIYGFSTCGVTVQWKKSK